MTYYTYLSSPIGQLLLTTDGSSITRLFMEDHEGGPTAVAGFADGPTGKFGSLPLKDWQAGDDLPILQTAMAQI